MVIACSPPAAGSAAARSPGARPTRPGSGPNWPGAPGRAPALRAGAGPPPPAAPGSRRPRARCPGSRPLPEAVTRSPDRGGLPGSAARSAWIRAGAALARSGLPGDRLDPPIVGIGGEVRRWPTAAPEAAGIFGGWPISSRPANWPWRTIRLPPPAPASGPGRPGYQSGYAAPVITVMATSRETAGRNWDMGLSSTRCRATRIRSMILMPMKGTIRPPTP